MAMRTRRISSGMPRIHDQLDAGTFARRGLDGEMRAGGAGALADDGRPQPPPIELVARHLTVELEAHPVVLDGEDAVLAAAGEPHDDVAGPGVFADVDERLLRDAHDLERDGGRQARGTA